MNATPPEILNIICPQCSKTWMNLQDSRTYFCYACNYVMFEKQVLAYFEAHKDDIHKVIYR